MILSRDSLLSDIRTTINLLAQYSTTKGLNSSTLISAITNESKNKNIVDLFVLREYLKDQTNALLSAEMEKESKEMEESTEDVDFESEDMEGLEDGETSEDLGEEGLESTEEEVDPEAEEFANKKQELLDAAEGYIMTIENAINSIQNGDVSLDLLKQLIDLKQTIQTAVDEVNSRTVDGNNNEATLGILQAVINNLEPAEGDEVNEEKVTLNDIIKNVSSGSMDSESQFNELITNIQEALSAIDTGEANIDESDVDAEFDYEKMEEENPEESEGSEDDKGETATDELVKDVEEKEGLTSSERLDDPSSLIASEINPESEETESEEDEELENDEFESFEDDEEFEDDSDNYEVGDNPRITVEDFTQKFEGGDYTDEESIKADFPELSSSGEELFGQLEDIYNAVLKYSSPEELGIDTESNYVTFRSKSDSEAIIFYDSEEENVHNVVLVWRDGSEPTVLNENNDFSMDDLDRINDEDESEFDFEDENSEDFEDENSEDFEDENSDDFDESYDDESEDLNTLESSDQGMSDWEQALADEEAHFGNPEDDYEFSEDQQAAIDDDEAWRRSSDDEEFEEFEDDENYVMSSDFDEDGNLILGDIVEPYSSEVNEIGFDSDEISSDAEMDPEEILEEETPLEGELPDDDDFLNEAEFESADLYEDDLLSTENEGFDDENALLSAQKSEVVDGASSGNIKDEPSLEATKVPTKQKPEKPVQKHVADAVKKANLKTKSAIIAEEVSDENPLTAMVATDDPTKLADTPGKANLSTKSAIIAEETTEDGTSLTAGIATDEPTKLADTPGKANLSKKAAVIAEEVNTGKKIATTPGKANLKTKSAIIAEETENSEVPLTASIATDDLTKLADTPGKANLSTKSAIIAEETQVEDENSLTAGVATDEPTKLADTPGKANLKTKAKIVA